MDLLQLLLGGGGVIGILSLIQMAPVKLNPWTSIGNILRKGLGALGRMFTKDLIDTMQKQDRVDQEMKDDIKRLTEALEGHILRGREEHMITIRHRILYFGDSVRRKEPHSEEYFNQILADITQYERYCAQHEEFQNSRTVLTIQRIKEEYQECLKEDKFL